MDYKKTYDAWVENCTDEEKKELLAIEDDEKEIKERFTLPLAFGTAGMRGTIALGISNMNVYTVARATKGLADYVNGLGAAEAERGVVVSYDTRRMSFEFALITARVLAANKINVRMFEDVRPVPMCSYAVRHTNAIAGVMITASHNPKEYNGYKVYGEDGAQMSPEATAVVVDFIDKTDYFGIKLADVVTTDRNEIKGKDGFKLNDYITVIGKSLDEDYYAEISKLSLSPEAVAAEGAKMKLVYSPIHGSGYVPVTTMLSRMGIKVEVVEEQKNPDTEFSTVVMPNPEQPDALKLGIKLADKISADVVIGTDPDCDRMGVAVRDDKGEFTLLTGNQIGALLLDYILLRHKERGDLPANGAVVKTIVTTNLADKIAKSYGMTVYDVLTGFKFIGEKIKEWESSGEHTFMFGYEESYGYLSGTHARDKDAVVAVMCLCEVAAWCKKHGKTLWDQMVELYEKYGYYKESLYTITLKGIDGSRQIAEMMDKLRKNPPTHFGDLQVTRIRDYASGVMKELATGKESPTGLPESNVLYFDLTNDSWCCARPSGTEPKIKFYMGVKGTSLADAQEKNEKLTEELKAVIE